MLLAKMVGGLKGEDDTTIPIPPDNFIKDHVDDSDRRPIQNRAGTFDGYVHVSSLAKDFCARKYAITIHEKLPLYETVTGGMRVVWAQGRASEDHARAAFIDQYGIRNIYAKWECESGEEGHDTYTALWKPTKCKCGKPVNKYNEAHLYDEENRVVGRPDLIFKYKNWLNIVEIKSIKSEIDSPNKNQHVTFEDLEEPIKDHKQQANFYPYLLGLKEQKVSPYVRYFYIAKAFKFGSPYKEFIIDHRDAKLVSARNELLSEAKELKDFFDNKEFDNKEEELVLPPRICPMFNAPLAKKCAVSSRCFYSYKE